MKRAIAMAMLALLIISACECGEQHTNGKHLYVVPDGYCHLAELKEGVDNG